MKKILLIISLFFTQITYGEYRNITIKQLEENGQNYLNEYVKIKCNSFESSSREILLNMDGEPTMMEDLGSKKLKNIDISDGKTHWIREEFITIVNDYDDFENCYLFNVNKREFVEKYRYRDIIMYGKIVDLENGKVGFKITKVEKQITLSNIWDDHPWITLLVIFIILFFIYGLLVRHGYITPEE
jgi:hypothetical protein